MSSITLDTLVKKFSELGAHSRETALTQFRKDVSDKYGLTEPQLTFAESYSKISMAQTKDFATMIHSLGEINTAQTRKLQQQATELQLKALGEDTTLEEGSTVWQFSREDVLSAQRAATSISKSIEQMKTDFDLQSALVKSRQNREEKINRYLAGHREPLVVESEEQERETEEPSDIETAWKSSQALTQSYKDLITLLKASDAFSLGNDQSFFDDDEDFDDDEGGLEYNSEAVREAVKAYKKGR